MKLEEFIGKPIYCSFKTMETPDTVVAVTLHAVDVGGIWIEYQQFTQTVLKVLKVESGSNTPVIFVPYSEINWIFQTAKSVPLGGHPKPANDGHLKTGQR